MDHSFGEVLPRWRCDKSCCEGSVARERSQLRPAATVRLWLAAISVATAAFVSAPSALAGFAVQPADGSTTSSAYPTFLVYVDDGETAPTVEVSTSPDHDDYGFDQLSHACYPTTPFGEPHKFSCKLLVPLSPGTYYWAYTF